MKPEDKVYWAKFFISVLIGLISAEVSASLEAAGVVFLIIFLATVVYIVSSRVLARLFLPEDSRTSRRIYLNGLGTYIGTFLVSWILAYNILLSL